MSKLGIFIYNHIVSNLNTFTLNTISKITSYCQADNLSFSKSNLFPVKSTLNLFILDSPTVNFKVHYFPFSFAL